VDECKPLPTGGRGEDGSRAPIHHYLGSIDIPVAALYRADKSRLEAGAYTRPLPSSA